MHTINVVCGPDSGSFSETPINGKSMVQYVSKSNGEGTLTQYEVPYIYTNLVPECGVTGYDF